VYVSREDSTESATPTSTAPVDDARREALRRIGKYGAYTAPALLAMMVAEKAPAATGV
jgi:hypothetical protein